MYSMVYLAVLSYLRFFARVALYLNKPHVIGITGSAGKSSTRDTIYGMLKDYFPTKMLQKGNSEIGIPLGILGLSIKENSFSEWIWYLLRAPFGVGYLKGVRYLVVEMGIDEPTSPKNMEFLLSVLEPEIAIFLNVHPVHTFQFQKSLTSQELQKTAGDPKKREEAIMKKIAEEKGKIITHSGCRIGIYNSDSSYINDVIARHHKEIVQIYGVKKTALVSFGKTDCDICYGAYDVDIQSTKFEFSFRDKEIMQIVIRRYALPCEYFEVCGAAILAGKNIGLTNSQIKMSIEKNFQLPAGRATIFQGLHNSRIIDSSYNASKVPVIAFLDLMYRIKEKEKRPLVFLFGDMRELGDLAEKEHKEVVDKILEGVDYLYCVGELTKKYVIPYLHSESRIQNSELKEVKHFNNSIEAGAYLKENLPENALVLVKGSQNTIFLEEAIKFLLLNREDEKRLCRQGGMWERKKKLEVTK